jgi:ketosteroid isomerase-like protein
VVSRTLWNFACCATLLAAAMAAGAAAPTAVAPAAIEQEIVRLEQGSNDAYAANDLPKYFGYYAEDAMLIFYNERTSLAAYRKSWPEAIKTEPIESVKLSDMVIRVIPSGDVAIASYQIDVRTKHPDGKATDEHAFETDVWVNRGGAWKIAHVQYSAKAAK